MYKECSCVVDRIALLLMLFAVWLLTPAPTPILCPCSPMPTACLAAITASLSESATYSDNEPTNQVGSSHTVTCNNRTTALNFVPFMDGIYKTYI